MRVQPSGVRSPDQASHYLGLMDRKVKFTTTAVVIIENGFKQSH